MIPHRQTYLIVGVAGTPSLNSRKEPIRNPFGLAFRRAAAETHTRNNQQHFESSSIEVYKDDIHKFLELLHSGLVPL